jgi:hypothetical protein
MPDRAWMKAIEPYLGKHYELDRLWREHLDLEAQLEELDRGKWLSPEQEQHRRKLQSKKLAGKDRMMAIAAELAGQR